jgi:hypothetical protein
MSFGRMAPSLEPASKEMGAAAARGDPAEVSGGETITATFAVTNTRKRAGADAPQV